MACCVKSERLLADYMDQVFREAVRTYAAALDPHVWSGFIEACAERDPRVRRWTPVVLSKLRENVHRILAEAGYLADTRSRTLQKVHVPESVAELLESADEARVLRILRVAE
jgi:hypothetical protein